MNPEPGANGQAAEQDTILVVDDDPAILDSVADLLTFAGYRVLTADDGRSALPLVRQYRPDLIVSDIGMRYMDGYELFEAVRSDSSWAAIPFVFLSALGEKKDIMLGQRLGADAYIAKPFEAEHLIDTIRTRLARVREIELITRLEVNRMKQQLITVFSHELRTPLTYIFGYISLLEDFTQLDEPTITEMIVGVRRGADRMIRLVEDLMLLVRIDGGVVETEVAQRRVPVDLAALLQTTIQGFEAQAAAKQVQITLEIANYLWVPCLGEYVQDVVARVISNAIKFRKQGGGEVRVRLERHGEYAAIVVSDDGIGIALDQQRGIFERFNQVDRDTMEQQGIGLGLTLARSLTRLHGGDIRVESMPSEGSTFTITLPLSTDDGGYEQKTARAATPGNGSVASRVA